MNIAVIGGGASGMMAALRACREGNRVTIYERQARLGKKLSATGNGRCNLSNRHAAVSHYHGADPAFTAPALERFGVEKTLSFFEELGLLTVTEADGKVYPFSDQANSVLDVLRLALEASGCALQLGCEIVRVNRRKGLFYLEYAGGCDCADRVIVACGGLAGERLGGVGAGYAILKSFGHRCTKLYPALTQLRTEASRVRSLKGVRCTAVVSLLQEGRLLAQEEGEVQFTEFGLSGPCVFPLARACAGRSGALEAVLDLCPCRTEEALLRALIERRQHFPALSMENYLTGLLHNRLGRTLLRHLGYAFELPAEELTQQQLRQIAAAIKRFSFPITGTMDVSQAQVTAGGILTSEFDPVTLESRLVPGLYATGEVLDIDGDCGGYNLQWAWSSGWIAGATSAADHR